MASSEASAAPPPLNRFLPINDQDLPKASVEIQEESMADDSKAEGSKSDELMADDFSGDIIHITPPKMLGVVKAQPYCWPHDASLSPQNTALVVIDMQKDFCMEGGYMHSQGYDINASRALIPGIQNLLFAFRTNGYPVYHTREGHRSDLSTLSARELFRSRNNPTGFGIGDRGPMGRLLVRGEEGHDTIPELYPLSGEAVIDKPGRGAFAHTEFELLLRLRGIKNLVICGVTTDVCVASTMREANDRGFDCVLVEDATAAANEELRASTVQSIKEEGGIFGSVCATDELLALV